MDYKKKYKQLHTLISDLYPFMSEYCKEKVEGFFPELAGSKDERIRKALLEMVHDTTGDELWVDYNVHKEEALAWLEKQGKQKSFDEILKIRQEVYQSGYNDEYKHGCEDTKKQGEQKSQRMISAEEKEAMYDKHSDKVEPKFKVGQWYQCTKDFFGKGVTFDKNTAYYCAKEGCLQDEYGCHIAIVKDLYDNFKLWNIEDAKDGDVLCTYECNEPKIVFILKGTPKKHYALGYHCYYNIMYPHFGSNFEKGCLSPNDEDVKPATKEQRDTLMKAMADAGYTFDFDKRELKKIEQKSAEWSEEDENILSNAIFFIREYQTPTRDKTMLNAAKEAEDWLKSLKQRIGG